MPLLLLPQTSHTEFLLSYKPNVLKQEADSLTTKLTTYDTQIDKLNSKIYVIKKQTQVKLDAVDNFGDDELERFFADRYRQSKDSIN